MKVCPECDAPGITANSGGVTGPKAESKYSCRCGARFDVPAERAAKNGRNTHGLAKKLEDMEL